jgi:uncharacterized protein (TIGR03435 family)
MLSRIFTNAILFALLCGQASGQSSGSQPAFEIADIHSSPSRLHPAVRGGVHGDSYLLRDATFVDLIAIAYKVDHADVFGGPSWLDFDRFDIHAKSAASTSDDAARLMLRGLLADRFSLVAQPGTRSLPAFVLSTGKSPKLKQSDASANTGGCEYQQPAKDAPSDGRMIVKFSCHNTTMSQFAEFLHDVASPYLTRPVIDATGLKGGWDFDLQWSYELSKGQDGITIFDAVDKQLGMTLESKPMSQPVVVVTSINEKPTPNPLGLDKLLPPAPPAQFEVAVIRPSNPDEKHFSLEMQPGGKVTVNYTSVQNLISVAFDIGTGRMVNKPSWLDQDRWDITGKAAVETATPVPGMEFDLDLEAVKEMLRSLLADRFKLTTHMEDQQADVFALLAANPKMKEADATNHPSCKEGPGPDGKDPRLENPLLNRLISCQNMTMAQLATELRNLAGGYVPAPVIDATSLQGAYDFTLSFSKKSDLRKGAPAAGSGDSSAEFAASEPSGGLTLFDALQKQLGLKLEKRDKVPMPTLVIDHVEQRPTEN